MSAGSWLGTGGSRAVANGRWRVTGEFLHNTTMIIVMTTRIITTASNTMIPPTNTPTIKYELITSKRKKEKLKGIEKNAVVEQCISDR